MARVRSTLVNFSLPKEVGEAHDIKKKNNNEWIRVVVRMQTKAVYCSERIGIYRVATNLKNVATAEASYFRCV